MEILFRNLTAPTPPAPGELYLLPVRAAPEKQAAVALLVLDEGLAAFPRGPGRVEKIVLDVPATFDDLLAATFATHLLAGQSLPEGCRAFAEYARLGRKGLRPSQLPFETSLEGLYLACRLEAGPDLTDRTTARRFTAHWSRLADCILRAAQAGLDPGRTPLDANDPEFDPAKKLLAGDHKLYLQDVARGQRWLVTLPGQASPVAGLFLREPGCTLFKHWSRCDPHSPSGQPYQFLTIQGKPGRWLFSVDPRLSTSLKPLAEKLQEAEATQQPAGANDRAWTVDETLGPTVVLSPSSGTALTDSQVLTIVRLLTSARVANPGPLRYGKAVAFCAIALAVLLAVWLVPRPHDPASYRGFRSDDDPAPQAAGGPRNLHVLAVGISRYRESKFKLAYARPDALALVEALKKQEGALFQKVFAQVLDDEKATREAVVEELNRLTQEAKPNDLVVVSLAGHGANLARDDRFYFLPYDFDPRKEVGSGISWSQLKELLGSMPCQVFVVLDTCHSGTATRGLTGQELAARGEHDKGIVVLAACLGRGLAQERSEWGHGVLTLALLEGLQGRYGYDRKKATELPRPNSRGEITIEELNHYVARRVEELVGSSQAVATANTGNMALQRIAIAVVKR